MADLRPYRLVFPQSVITDVLAPLATGQRRYAWGRVVPIHSTERRELLVHALQFTDDIPRGDMDPPLMDWVFIESARDHGTSHVHDLIRACHVGPHQTMAVLGLGLGPEQDAWIGAVVRGNTISALDEMLWVGPGMPLFRPFESIDRTEAAEDTSGTTRRWSRLIGAIGQPTWDQIANQRVLLFGAGRNGSLMAFMLAAIGVKSLYIVDMDRLHVENLDAMFLVNEEDVGKYKAHAVQRSLHRFRSDCVISSLNHSVNHAAVANCARSVDLIVSCVDSDTPRLAAAMLANRLLKVHLDVGTLVANEGSSNGDVTQTRLADIRLMLPRDCCVCCTPGLRNYESAVSELNSPPGILPDAMPLAWNEQRAGSLITLNSIAVSMGLQSWIDLLADSLRGSIWHRVELHSGGAVETQSAIVAGSDECKYCHSKNKH